MKLPVYPSCFVRNSLVVTVVDGKGSPIPGATVDISCAESPDTAIRGISPTNKDGVTPSELKHALAITFIQYRATNDPKKTKRMTFTYEITVTAGEKAKTIVYDTAKDHQKSITITMN